MSLTETILFNKQISFPKGRRRTHSMDNRHRYEETAGRADYNARNAATRTDNVERVFTAVDDGHDTTEAIIEATGLSKSTVQKALHELEDWPSGGRIKRKTGRVHRFVSA